MDPLVALVLGSGWASGVNLYLVVALLGVAGRLDFVDLPLLLTSPWTIGIAAALFLVEFFADKIPLFDNVWDAIHTVVRPVGAAALGYILTGDVSGLTQLGAAGGSGALALAAHAAKATTRAAANSSPEPFSNSVLSIGEDGLAAFVIWLAITNPLIALIVVLVLLVAGTAAAVLLWRFVRKRVNNARERRGSRSGPPGARVR